MIAPRAFVSEAVGTALLLAAVVASGIVTSDGDPDPSVQLLQHGIVVGLALAVLITLLAPSSGAHFNPIVTVAMWWSRDLTGRIALGYVAAQVTGACAGTAVVNLMLGLAAFRQATGLRAGMPVLGGELLASAALLLVILGLVRTGRTSAVPAAVGTWISAAIFFTSSTSLADPAATLARAATDTYVGIAPESVPAFLSAQVAALLLIVPFATWLFPRVPPVTEGHLRTTLGDHR